MSEKKGKVYIVQEVYGRDYLPAAKYGELIPLLTAETQIYLSATPAVRKLARSLSKFTDDDYLVLVGDPVLIGLATALAAGANRGRVKVLKWDRRSFTYHCVQIDLYPKEESNGEE
jgi:hypothetical protein